MKHLARYIFKDPQLPTGQFTVVIAYLQDLDGKPAPINLCWLQDTKSGNVKMVSREFADDHCTERTAELYNPPRGEFGGWREVYYCSWEAHGRETVHIPAEAGEPRNVYLIRAQQILAPDTVLPLIAGHIYRAKKPCRSGWGEVNDRSILHLGMNSVQYDSPSLARGRRYPSIKTAQFLAWAGEDVTEQYKEVPEGEWMKWENLKKPKSS